MTIEAYLNAIVLPNYIFSDLTLQAVLSPKTYNLIGGGTIKNDGTEIGTDMSRVPAKELDLSTAELWRAASGMLNSGGESKTMGNRRITSASVQTSEGDRAEWRLNAQMIYNNYKISSTIPNSDVAIITNETKSWK